MEQIVNIVAIGKKEICQQIYDRFKEHVPNKELEKLYKFQGGLLTVTLKESSPQIEEAVEVMKENGLDPALFADVYCTKRELDNDVKFFVMTPNYPTELEGTGEDDYGTEFVGGCPSCGVGSKAKKDILVDRKLMKKCTFGCLVPDYVVSKEVKEIIEANGLTGITFEKRVKDYKGRDMDDFYAVNFENILPQMSEKTWWLIQKNQQCKTCGYCLTYIRSNPRYEENNLITAKDFNLTQEYYNNDKAREIIVSAKVRKVFKENKIRVGFKPVTLL